MPDHVMEQCPKRKIWRIKKHSLQVDSLVNADASPPSEKYSLPLVDQEQTINESIKEVDQGINDFNGTAVPPSNSVCLQDTYICEGSAFLPFSSWSAPPPPPTSPPPPAPPLPTSPPPLVAPPPSLAEGGMANFPVMPFRFLPGPVTIEPSPEDRLQRSPLIVGDPPLQHEEYAIIVVIPELEDIDKEEALAEVCTILNRDHNAPVTGTVYSMVWDWLDSNLLLLGII
jgi:hypothetical protein